MSESCELVKHFSEVAEHEEFWVEYSGIVYAELADC